MSIRTSRGGLARAAIAALLAATVATGPDARGDAEPGEWRSAGVFRSPATGRLHFVEVEAGGTKRLRSAAGGIFGSVRALVFAEEQELSPLERALHPDLLRPEVAGSPAPVGVTLMLREQTYAAAADARRAELYARIAPQLARARALVGRVVRSGDPTLFAEEERLQLDDAERAELRAVADRLLALRSEFAEAVLAEGAAALAPVVERVRERLHAVGAEDVSSETAPLAAFTARVPGDRLAELVRSCPEVARVLPRERAECCLLQDSVILGAKQVWDAGWTGGTAAGRLDVGLLDSGVDAGHPAFAHGVKTSVHLAAGAQQSDFNDVASSADDVKGHGTAMAGIIAGEDTTYRGMAPGVNLVSAKVAYRTSDSKPKTGSVDSDIIAGGAWAVTNGADLLNISLASKGTNDGTAAVSLWADAVVSSLGLPVAAAAGNFNDSINPQPETIARPADAFNVVSVGGHWAYDTWDRSDDYHYTPGGRGPTADDRAKPDLVAPQGWTTSASWDWEVGNDFDSINTTGTSASTAFVTGAQALLLDSGAAATPEGLKALLMANAHNGDRAVDVPDAAWAHGPLRIDAAFLNRAGLAEGLFTAAGSREFVLGTGALPKGARVRLCWNRHVTYSGSAAPTTYLAPTDLDLYVYDGATGELLGKSDSTVDNVEHVTLGAAVASAVVRVRRAGDLPEGITTEPFAVAVEQSAQVKGPPAPAVTVDLGPLPEYIGAGVEFDVRAEVRNDGPVPLFGGGAELRVPAGYEFVDGGAFAEAESVGPGEKQTVTWRVRAGAGPSGPRTLDARSSAPQHDGAPVGEWSSESQLLDAVLPTAAVRIEGEPFATSGDTVALLLEAADPGEIASGVADLRVRNDAEPWSEWAPFAARVDGWRLRGLEGRQVVGVEVRDVGGNVSLVAEANVVRDVTPPGGGFLLNDGLPYVLPGAAVTAQLTGQDGVVGSGIDRFRYQLDDAPWTPWVEPADGLVAVDFVAPGPGAPRDVTVRGQTRDRAGLASLVFTRDLHAIDPASPSLTRLTGWSGALDPADDVDAFPVDYVAGQTLTIGVKAKSKAKGKRKPEIEVAARLHRADGSVAASWTVSTVGKSDPVTYVETDPAATGVCWLTFHVENPGLTSVGLKLKVKRSVPVEQQRLRGLSDPDPETGFAEVRFDAAEGTELTGRLSGVEEGAWELTGPRGDVLPLAPRVRKGKAKLPRTLLAPGTGTWTLRCAASGTVEHDLVLKLAAKGKGREPTAAAD